MAVIPRIWVFMLFAFWQAGCTSVQHISNSKVSYEPVSTNSTPESSESITAMITPYREQLEVQMNEVLGHLNQEMTKKKPESTLGNWFSDAILAAATGGGHQVDFAISNYGGIRIPSLSAGPLTRGEVYELCPFDNLIVIVEIPGNLLETFLQDIAMADGWPVSNGIRMIIQDKKMISCTIGGRLLNPDDSYKVAMSDYVANGGDEMGILIPLPRVQTGVLVRDALMTYAQEATKSGKEINASIEGRIIKQ